MEAPKSPWRYPHLFLAGKSPKFGKSQPRSPTQCPPQPTSPRARYLSPASAQRQTEVQHHATPRAVPPRPPLRRTESTSTCSSAGDASGLAEQQQQQQQQRHRRRRSLSASEAKKTAADVVAVKVDHAESRDDGMGIVGVLDTGNECKGSECRGGRTNT